jgi:hypothetical protein
MSDEQILSSTPLDAPVVGHAATALPLAHELDSAASLVPLTQIPIITQESQQGKFSTTDFEPNNQNEH